MLIRDFLKNSFYVDLFLWIWYITRILRGQLYLDFPKNPGKSTKINSREN